MDPQDDLVFTEAELKVMRELAQIIERQDREAALAARRSRPIAVPAQPPDDVITDLDDILALPTMNDLLALDDAGRPMRQRKRRKRRSGDVDP
jgi:hypothetical protein